MKNNGFELLKRDNPEKPGEFYYAARCRPFGLTAYGSTPEEAWSRLGLMFNTLMGLTWKNIKDLI